MKRLKIIELLAGICVCLLLVGCAELERVNMDYYGVSAPAGSVSKGGKANCPDCGKSLTYVADYKRWYCESEGKYMDEGYNP